MAQPYRPANGTEGDEFISRWCDRCVRGTEDDPCPILGATLFLAEDDPDYPTEWAEDENGPRCTAFATSQDDTTGIIPDARQPGLF